MCKICEHEGFFTELVTYANMNALLEYILVLVLQTACTYTVCIVKLCLAAGFLDISTVMRMARNYNIVYRMGLDMTGLESFVRANSSRHKTHHNKVPQTVITISIPLVVNQLLRQLGDNPNSNIT